MPIREYECPECGEIIEDITFSKEEKVFCEKCNVEMKMIAVSSSNFHLKGLGWPGGDAMKQKQRWYDKI